MTKEQLKEIIDSGEKHYIYFYSPWCRACRRMSYLVDRERTPLVRVNGEENTDILKAFGIEYYPTIVEIIGNTKKVHSGTESVRKLLK